MKLGEAVYKAQQAEGGEAGAAGADSGGDTGDSGAQDDVVDADFEEVDDQNQNKSA